MLCYFGPDTCQGKENVPKQNKVSSSHQWHFLGLPFLCLVPAVPMHLCPPVGSISLFHNLHHHIPYVQAAPSVIQSIQMLEWALSTLCFRAVETLVHLALSAAAILALCLF